MNAETILTRLCRAMAFAVLPATVAFASTPAWAQLQVPPAPVINSVDSNGVDLVNLTFSVNLGSISVGPAEGGLTASFSRTEGRRLDAAHDRLNLVGGINEWHDIHPFVIRRFTVTLMGRATVFTRTTSGTFVFKEGQGGTLVQTTARVGLEAHSVSP